MFVNKLMKVIYININFNVQKRFISLFYSKFCKLDNIEHEVHVIKKEYDVLLSECLDTATHKCYVIQPYVKWGAEKVRDRTPSQRLEEATQLAGWIKGWSVAGGECLGVHNSRGTLGSGQRERLAETLNRLGEITALLINVPLLEPKQISDLSYTLPGRPRIFDRAALVLQLVREQIMKGTHAHAQLQLAELEYVTRRFKDDRSKYVISARRSQLVTQLEICKNQRDLQRKRRRDADLPVIAVVGYTNAGKSSLVSALVGSEVCSTSERAFHTLDVIGRAAELPSGLRVLYMDTVGFLSDTPQLLMPLFTATLEDVLLADILLHVVDTSHQEVKLQKDHVENELSLVYKCWGVPQAHTITVGNKLDLRKATETNKGISHWDLAVSAVQGTGIDTLRLATEKALLRVTGRQVLTLRLPAGSDEVQWMYKNAVVLGQMADTENAQSMLVRVIITKAKMEQFYAHFIKESNSQ